MTVDPDQIDQLLTQVQDKAAQVAAEGGTEAPPAGLSTELPVELDPSAVAGEFDAPLPETGNSQGRTDIKRLLSIEVPVIVQLGQRRMNVSEVMRLGVGAIIEFSKSAEDEMDLLVNNKTVGKGSTVKVGENFGIKISSIGPVKDMIKKLGAG